MKALLILQNVFFLSPLTPISIISVYKSNIPQYLEGCVLKLFKWYFFVACVHQKGIKEIMLSMQLMIKAIIVRHTPLYKS